MSIVPQLVANSLIAGSLYALVALGFNLIFSTTKFFNITHGVISAIGGYGVFYFAKKLGWGVPVSILAAIAIAAFVGWLTDYFVFRKMRAKKSSSMIMLVASLGLFTAIQAVIAIFFSSQFQTLPALVTGRVEIFGAIFTSIQIVILATTVVITLGLAFIIKKTKFGKAVQAVSDDVEVAQIVGIKSDVIIGRVFIIGSAIAAVAGIAIGFDTGIEPTMGMSLLLKGVIASIIGGVGNVFGGVLGAFLLGFVENFGIWKISGEWKDAIAFGLLIVFLIFRPQGMFKKK
jgi:branched-chain amino acid transport system permease protein